MRSLYRAGSLTAAARELARYKLDIVGVQEVRWENGAPYEEGTVILYMEKEMKIISWKQDFLYTTKQYQQLREESLLAIGCHI